MLQLEHSGSMFQLEHTGDLRLYVTGLRWNIPGTIVLNVPAGTFKNGKNLRRKLLIPGAGFSASQWIQGDSLWKKCLLSRTLNVY
jgi:hypothetical protein